jgi:5,10-methylenetetrahydromethanopterin reductase
LGWAFKGYRPIAEYSKIASVMEQYNFGWMHIYDDLAHRPAWPILFSLTSSTKRMAIGPAVTHPFLQASGGYAWDVACLDEATNGRAILGLGRGAYYECFGMQPKHQLAVLREAVKIITHLLTGDKSTYIGNYFSINECGGHRFRLIRKQIPIFLGTWGPKTSQLAGELKQITGIKADSLWNPEYARVLKNNIIVGASKSVRDPSEVSMEVGVMTYISNDLGEARIRA